MSKTAILGIANAMKIHHRTHERQPEKAAIQIKISTEKLLFLSIKTPTKLCNSI